MWRRPASIDPAAVAVLDLAASAGWRAATAAVDKAAEEAAARAAETTDALTDLARGVSTAHKPSAPAQMGCADRLLGSRAGRRGVIVCGALAYAYRRVAFSWALDPRAGRARGFVCSRLAAAVGTLLLVAFGAVLSAAGAPALGEAVTVAAVGMLLSTLASLLVRGVSATHDSHDAHATRVALTATAAPALMNVFWMLLRGASVGGAGGVLDMGVAGVHACRALDAWLQV